MALQNPVLNAEVNNIGLEVIKNEMGTPPWSRQIVLTEHVSGNVICQNSGQINDRHCHDYDEWWCILEGEIDWIVEGREDRPVEVKAGDFVFVPAQTFHQIFPKGDGPSIRLAIALPGHGHLHEKPERKVNVRFE